MLSRSTAAVRRILLGLPAAAVLATTAHAQLTTDRGASIVVFPKVVADASADTVIQLTNTSDNAIAARCAYVDGSTRPWQAHRFAVEIGPRRQLYWTAARGRTDTQPPIDVPAAPAEFRGELLCVQVDPTGAPFSGNEVAGQATVHDLANGDVVTYSAAGLRGSGLNDGDDVLCIGGEPSDSCIIGAEYDPCPAEWILSVPGDGAADPQLGAGSLLSSRLTVVPCSQNLRDAAPATVAMTIDVFNELGEHFSDSASVTCWADLALADIAGAVFTLRTLGTDFAEARLRPAPDSGGFILVAETTRTAADSTLVGSAALVPQHRGGATASDLIIFPMGGATP